MLEQKLDVSGLATSYRKLVLWFGAQLVIGIAAPLAMVVSSDPTLILSIALARLIGIIVTIVALGYYSYRTSAALGSRVSVLWAVAMLVPCINVITLLVLSSKATKACREAGIRVGLLGPKDFRPTGGTTHDERAG